MGYYVPAEGRWRPRETGRTQSLLCLKINETLEKTGGGKTELRCIFTPVTRWEGANFPTPDHRNYYFTFWKWFGYFNTGAFDAS